MKVGSRGVRMATAARTKFWPFCRAVWARLAMMPWVSAPVGERLPAHSFRAITAGRCARSAALLVGSTSG